MRLYRYEDSVFMDSLSILSQPAYWRCVRTIAITHVGTQLASYVWLAFLYDAYVYTRFS